MSSSLSRAALASIFAAIALSACSGSSSNSCQVTSDCGAGRTCKSGQCLAAGECPSGILSCTDSAGCGTGSICTSGCCAPVEGCASSSDCTDPTRPHCDSTTNACVPCTGDTECAAGKVCTATGACEPSCTSDSNCSAPTAHCVTAGGYCAQCTASSQCPSSAPFCDNNVCFGCSSNASCSAPTPVCNTTTKACVTCIDSQNASGKNSACAGSAATPACENGACVACNPSGNDANTGANGACPSATPVCSATSACVQCTASSQCPSGGTCDTGSNTCETVTLSMFTASTSTVVLAGASTLTATLNGPVTSPVTINVDVAGDGGVAGTLSSPTIVISTGTTGSTTYIAPATAGTAVVEASFGGVTLSTPIIVTSAALAIASIDLPATPAAPGSAVQATVTLNAGPAADTNITISVDNGANIGGSTSATTTVHAGSATSDPFTIQLACNNGPTTATATLGASSTLMAVVPITASNPAVASLVASSLTPAMGAAINLTATLTEPAGCGGTYVTLLSSIVFTSENKYSGFIPSYILVPEGQTSATISAVPECDNNSGDVINVIADVLGTPPVAVSAPGSDAGTVLTITPTSGLSAGQVALCPIAPVSGDRPLTYLLGDGGTAPLPVLITVGFADYKPPTQTYSITLAASGVDGGSCGSFSQDGGTITGLSFSSPKTTEISFVPGSDPGPCTLYAQGTGTDGGTTTIYDAGIVSTLNLVAFDWTQQQTPTDLTLSKAEIAEDTKLGTTNGLSDGGTIYGDQNEYVEIYNPTANAIDLSAYTLVFVGSAFDNSDGGPAAKSEYWSYPLSGVVMPGHYAIAQDANTFDAGPGSTDQLLTWPDAGSAALAASGLDGGPTSSSKGVYADGNIANAPGGIFLVKAAGTASATIVDGLTYGAPMQQATSESITGVAGGIFSWPPAPLLPLDNYILDNSFVKGSLVRIGFTGSPALDWADSTTVTPGEPNNLITGP